MVLASLPSVILIVLLSASFYGPTITDLILLSSCYGPIAVTNVIPLELALVNLFVLFSL